MVVGFKIMLSRITIASLIQNMKVAVINDVGTLCAKKTSSLILIDEIGPFLAVRMTGKFASISLTNPPLHYGPFGL